MITAAAPSTIPEAEAAVTTPSGLNVGRRLFISSRDASSRKCSSLAHSPFLKVKGAISPCR